MFFVVSVVSNPKKMDVVDNWFCVYLNTFRKEGFEMVPYIHLKTILNDKPFLRNLRRVSVLWVG